MPDPRERTDWEDLVREWTRAGFEPASFWHQTPASYAAALRGRLKARSDDLERILFGAWKGEFFAREEKLRGFAYYLKKLIAPARPRSERQTPAEMLAAYASRASAGAPIRIELVEKPGSLQNIVDP